MQAVEGLAPADGVAPTLQEVEPRPRVGGRPGEARDPGDRQAVHARNHAVPRCGDLPDELTRLQAAGEGGGALGLGDGLQLGQGRAALDQFAGPGLARPARTVGVQLDQPPGQADGLGLQVRRRPGLAAQHGQDVPRLQGRSHAPPHRVRSVGLQDLDLQPDPVGDELEKLAKPQGRLRIAHLGARPDRQVQEEVGGARRQLLGEDRGHHLLGGVEGQGPLHRDQDVVHRRQVHASAPDDAAAAALDHGAHLVLVQVHPGQHLHGVRRPGRGGDGPRGRLGRQQAVGRRHGRDDQRGPVSRNAADAVLVGHQGTVPDQPATGAGHGAGQGQGLLGGHEAGAGDQEGRDLDVRPAVVGQVMHHRLDLGVGQGRPGDLGAQGLGALRRRGGRDPDLRPRRNAEPPEGRLRQPRLARPDQGGVVADHHGGHQGAPAGPHLHLARARQPLRPQGAAVPGQEHGVLAEGVDGQGPDGQQHGASAGDHPLTGRPGQSPGPSGGALGSPRLSRLGRRT
uniref:Uncharacterized protein n=1 Tax=uncultured bacterium CBNPD1 BAC clone 1664 TaxID=417310 RepID=B1N6N8_9BACT|nr:conserved hypothetical protein [uncultured bacterium CBNPD1 BAC clone 1664]